ncbi:MAG: tetratricopeptide repeat protein [bacterium]
MKITRKCRAVSLILTLGFFLSGMGVSYGQIAPGQSAPLFSLKDIAGKSHDLAQMKNQPMIILYFFDAESRPSQEGIVSLNQLARQYKGYDLTTLAITLSPRAKIDQFRKQTDLGFPIIQDQSGISDRYQARQILPTVCIIGPGLRVLDHFQGGGKTTEVMLVRLAERELQRKQTTLAKAISAEVVKKNPHNTRAKTVAGYAALREGNLKQAQEVFQNLAKDSGQAEVLGKEGLAAVHVQKGEAARALELAREIEHKAPERSYVHVIKGDILASQDKKQEAEAEYQKAIAKKDAEPYQEAVRHNQLGRLYASSGQYQKARELYDQAVAIDPYYIEGTTNKGITYQKEGNWDKALESFQQAVTLDKGDTFAVVLAKKAQEMLEFQKDNERKKRVDQLVKDLAERYRSQEKSRPKDEDTWTSRPMIISFVDFQEKGGLAERDGFSTVMTSQLSDSLTASNRVQVVERVLIERLMEELNLGSSDLADQETALKLGRVLAAKLIGTGSLFYLPNGTLLNLRLIDSETSAIPLVITRQISPQASLEKELYALNRQILRTVMEKYPLHGYLVEVTGDQALVNLGSRQGVVQGTRFEVLEEGKPITYKGKTLQSSPKIIAQAEVVRVEPDLCHIRIISQERPLKTDDKVQERIAEAVLGEGSEEGSGSRDHE